MIEALRFTNLMPRPYVDISIPEVPRAAIAAHAIVTPDVHEEITTKRVAVPLRMITAIFFFARSARDTPVASPVTRRETRLSTRKSP